jgi:hypothetical protein
MHASTLSSTPSDMRWCPIETRPDRRDALTEGRPNAGYGATAKRRRLLGRPHSVLGRGVHAADARSHVYRRLWNRFAAGHLRDSVRSDVRRTGGTAPRRTPVMECFRDPRWPSFGVRGAQTIRPSNCHISETVRSLVHVVHGARAVRPRRVLSEANERLPIAIRPRTAARGIVLLYAPASESLTNSPIAEFNANMSQSSSQTTL